MRFNLFSFLFCLAPSSLSLELRQHPSCYDRKIASGNNLNVALLHLSILHFLPNGSFIFIFFFFISTQLKNCSARVRWCCRPLRFGKSLRLSFSFTFYCFTLNYGTVQLGKCRRMTFHNILIAIYLFVFCIRHTAIQGISKLTNQRELEISHSLRDLSSHLHKYKKETHSECKPPLE